MRVTVLNGDPGDRQSTLEGFLVELAGRLSSAGHEVRPFSIRQLDVKRCTGCWGCWVKTPGECVIRDDMSGVLRGVIAADLLVFASPVIMGLTSGVLKRATDRLLPLLHPYIEIVNGACRHRRRYDRVPLCGLLLDRTGADDDDLEIIRDIYGEIAEDFRSELRFTRFADENPQEVADEIDRL